MIYSSDRGVSLNPDSLSRNDRVIVCDDFLASGGTASAVVNLVKEFKCVEILGLFVFEVVGAGGRKSIEEIGADVVSLADIEFIEADQEWRVTECRVDQ